MITGSSLTERVDEHPHACCSHIHARNILFLCNNVLRSGRQCQFVVWTIANSQCVYNAFGENNSPTQLVHANFFNNHTWSTSLLLTFLDWQMLSERFFGVKREHPCNPEAKQTKISKIFGVRPVERSRATSVTCDKQAGTEEPLCNPRCLSDGSVTGDVGCGGFKTHRFCSASSLWTMKTTGFALPGFAVKQKHVFLESLGARGPKALPGAAGALKTTGRAWLRAYGHWKP